MKVIVIEGLDKSGKHSTAKILADSLKSKGFKVVQSEFHRYDTPTGRLIQKWLYKGIELKDVTLESILEQNKKNPTTWQLTDQVEYLIAQSNNYATLKGYVDDISIEYIMTSDKQAQQNWFNQLEQEGVDFLILDRYIGSQVCYSLAKGNDVGWVISLQEGMRKPDLEIFLDIPPEVSMSRKGKHGENDRYESNRKFLSDVRKTYIEYFKKLPTRVTLTDISSLSKEEVGKKVNLIVDEYILD